MAAAPFLFVLLWSLSFITAKAGLRHLSPLRFVAIRLACAVVLMVLMILLRCLGDHSPGGNGCSDCRRSAVRYGVDGAHGLP
jgi:drug/metabolite transporter (DMT)-like permease